MPDETTNEEKRDKNGQDYLPRSQERHLEAVPNTSSLILDELIEYVAEQLAFCVRKAKIMTRISLVLYGEDLKKPGWPKQRIDGTTYEKIAGKARAMLRARSVISRTEAREESIGFYDTMLASDNVEDSAKIKCRQNLDKMLGIAVADPVAGQNSMPARNTIGIKDVKMSLSEKRALLAKMREEQPD
jgi:hypothetical protein